MLNERLTRIGHQPSAIRELFEFGKQRAVHVGKENVFDFSLGNPSVPPPPQVREAMEYVLSNMTDMELHGYTSAAGDVKVRDAVASGLNSRYGTSYTHRNICMTCGAAAALISCFSALTLDENSEFIALAPYFPEYNFFSATAGAKLTVVPADTENFQIDFEALESRINRNTQAVIVNSPNNPSGTVLSRETVIRLAELLIHKSAETGHTIYIISDEPYRELVYGDMEVPFIASYYPNTLVCYSFSKSLSLPGERIGYILAPDELENFEDVCAATLGALRMDGYVCAPSLMQHVVARCAAVPPDLSAYRKNRDLFYGALTEMGYRCAQPDGAFYLFVEAPNCTAQEFSEAAKRHDVLVVAGDSFGCPSHFRLCYCVDYGLIERSLPAFRALYEEFAK